MTYLPPSVMHQISGLLRKCLQEQEIVRKLIHFRNSPAHKTKVVFLLQAFAFLKMKIIKNLKVH